MKNVKVHCSDGTMLQAVHSGGGGKISGNYEFHPGDFCKIEPVNSKKLKNRNRRCQLTGDYSKITGEARVLFLDSNKEGFVNVTDLMPDQPPEASH